MAHDPNRAGNEAAKLSQRFAKENMDELAKMGRHPPGGTTGKQGGLLGFIIVVGLIALVAFWIASKQ